MTQINGETVLLPILFWKVIVFPKEDGKLYRVGFMMGQRKLLVEHGIVDEIKAITADDDLFMQFDDAATYQVNVPLIEKLADLQLPKAIDIYKDDRNIKLILKEVDINPDLKSFSVEQTLGFTILNIVL